MRLSCDQMCGSGHFSMRGIVKVVTPEEFILWRAKQESNYAQVMKDKLPAARPADSVKTAAVKTETPVETGSSNKVKNN